MKWEINLQKHSSFNTSYMHAWTAAIRGCADMYNNYKAMHSQRFFLHVLPFYAKDKALSGVRRVYNYVNDTLVIDPEVSTEPLTSLPLNTILCEFNSHPQNIFPWDIPQHHPPSSILVFKMAAFKECDAILQTMTTASTKRVRYPHTALRLITPVLDED
jgi:hypothetical protein